MVEKEGEGERGKIGDPKGWGRKGKAGGLGVGCGGEKEVMEAPGTS